MSATAVTSTPLAVSRRHALMFVLVAAVLVAVAITVFLAIAVFADDTTRDYIAPGPGSQLEHCLNTVGRTHC